MISITDSRRERAGLSLLSVGVLLVAFAVAMMMVAVPPALGTAFPNGDVDCDGGATGGYKIGIAGDAQSGTFDEALGVVQGDIVWSVTEVAQFAVVNTPGSPTGWYLNYTYTNNNGYDLWKIRIKTGGGSNPGDDGFIVSPANPGSISIPSATSHITFCFTTSTTPTTTTTTTEPPTTTTTTEPPTTTTTTEPPTTTTTTEPPTTTTTTEPPTTTTTTEPPTTTTTTEPPTTTTSTTIGGPSTTTSTTDPTTTTTTSAGTTTTVGGPSTTVGQTTTTVAGPTTTVPDLPNTGGGGNLLLLAVAGLGMLLTGAGLLLVADERRRGVTVA